MDKTAKKVLEYITGQGVEYFGTFVDTYLQEMASDIGIGKTELSAALVYLKEKNYIKFFQAYGEKKNNAFRLTHEGMHYKEIRYLEARERWIERIIGFISGVLVSVLGGVILALIV